MISKKEISFHERQLTLKKDRWIIKKLVTDFKDSIKKGDAMDIDPCERRQELRERGPDADPKEESFDRNLQNHRRQNSAD